MKHLVCTYYAPTECKILNRQVQLYPVSAIKKIMFLGYKITPYLVMILVASLNFKGKYFI